MAARLVKDDDSFQSIRTVLRAMTIPFPSNQFLQAASVAGDKDLLRKIARKPAEQIRAGNLALALADAGLTSEFEALLATVGENGFGNKLKPAAQRPSALAVGIWGSGPPGQRHPD